MWYTTGTFCGDDDPRAMSSAEPIPTLDLHAQFREVEPDVRAAMDRVLASQHFILGKEGEALEAEIAAYSGSTHAVGVSSGTDAILVGLMALGVGPGDDVVTTPYTFLATATCIARLGARAVLIDIDPDTFALDATRLDAAITAKTKAIVPVHLFGQMADMRAVHAVADARKIPVLEDAAQAIGARRDDLPVGRGSIGATLSFFPSKNLGCMGDGGMVISDDADFAGRVRLLRNQGQKPKYTSQMVGGNFRLDELQAAVVRAKLPRLDAWTAARQAHARHYREAFAAQNLGPRLLTVTPEVPNVRHVYNQLVIRTPHREALREHLMARGIGCTVYYPVPMHLQPCFADWGYAPGAFPESERAANESLALPLYPELSSASVDRVVDEVSSFLLAAPR
jgi:dTDP-4-amino-4,6-dideoxygalactose transaminase